MIIAAPDSAWMNNAWVENVAAGDAQNPSMVNPIATG
jgi:hypothetical protein